MKKILIVLPFALTVAVISKAVPSTSAKTFVPVFPSSDEYIWQNAVRDAKAWGAPVSDEYIWQNAIRDVKDLKAKKIAEAKRAAEAARIAAIRPSYSDAQARYDESMGWGPEQQRLEEIANQ
jgi:hypothetical protein